MSTLDSELDKQLYKLIDSHHSIVTEELGDNLVKGLRVFIQQREGAARIDELLRLGKEGIWTNTSVRQIKANANMYISDRYQELTQPPNKETL